MEDNYNSENEEEESFEGGKPSKLQKFENENLHLNPFEVEVILGVFLQYVPLEDLKKCRLISCKWNEYSCSELAKRPQKLIEFETVDDLNGPDGTLGQLMDLTTGQDDDDRKMAHLSSFKFDINLLSCPQIDQFFTKFGPKFVKISGSYGVEKFARFSPEPESDGENDLELERTSCTAPTDLFKFLLQIAHTVQEIDYSFRIHSDFTPTTLAGYCETLSKAKFAKLKKITLSCKTEHCEKFTEMIFYSIIGRNAGKFKHLKLTTGKGIYQGGVEAMSSISKSSGLMSKLKILEFLNVDSAILDVFTDFGQGGVLQLVKFKYDNTSILGQVQGLVNFLQSQSRCLKSLHISRIEEFQMGKYREIRSRAAAHSINLAQILQYESTKSRKFPSAGQLRYYRGLFGKKKHRMCRIGPGLDSSSDEEGDQNDENEPEIERPPSPPRPVPIIPIGFPILPQLSHLQIDYFTSWLVFFEPLNFSLKFPKLRNFATHNMEGFLKREAGHSGETIQSITIFKNVHMDQPSFDEETRLDFTKLGEIFKNPAYLELNSFALPVTGSQGENIPFWMGLQKVVIHFEMKDLIDINLLLLRVIRKLHLDVNCGRDLMDDVYSMYLGGLIRNNNANGDKFEERLDNNNQKKFYEKFLSTISRACCIHPVSFKIFGYKTSEIFKRDFRSIFPGCIFVETGKV